MSVRFPNLSVTGEISPGSVRDKASLARDFWISLAFIAVVAVYYFTLLPTGNIQHGDEYLTLDRSHSFMMRDDYLAVYTFNEPDFKKPPLQYWMTAALLQAGFDTEAALRFPSYLFSILALIATGVLAFLLNPKKAYVAPAAIALLAGSATFWESAISGLLDAGAMLFATLAVTSVLLALRQPRWWYLMAAAVGVGALQKAPVPLAHVGVMVVVAVTGARPGGLDVRRTFANRHFVLSVVLMLLAVMFWPLLQFAKFGMAAIQEAYVDQMVDRFSPLASEEAQGRRSWFTIMLAGEPVLRLPAIAALAALPWVMRRRELASLPLLLLLFAVLSAFASGYVSPRYSLIFLPMLMAALAAVTFQVFGERPVIGYALAIALAVSSLGPIKSATALGIDDAGKSGNVPLLEVAGKALQPAETLVICRGARDGKRLYPGAVAYYASNGRPFIQIREVGDIVQMEQRGEIAPPYRGLCHSGQADDLRAAFGAGAIVEETGGFVHWQSSGR
jgi:4-amino-4-deoxy-L-arabinose transferase-like glycosyltransferase